MARSDSSKDTRRGCIVLLLLPGLLPLFIAWLTWSEHRRRDYVLTHGRGGVAEVTRTRQIGGRLNSCQVDFVYDRDGDYTSGKTFGCGLMKRHPEGSRVLVRFDSGDPRGALIVGDSTWPNYWPAPLALTAIWLGYAWALYPPAKGKKRRRARPRT